MITAMGRGKFQDEHRAEICEWVKANGLDPAQIREDAPVTIAGGQIATRVVIRDESGKVVPSVDGDHSSATRAVTVPLRVQPTPVVREWLNLIGMQILAGERWPES